RWFPLDKIGLTLTVKSLPEVICENMVSQQNDRFYVDAGVRPICDGNRYNEESCWQARLGTLCSAVNFGTVRCSSSAPVYFGQPNAPSPWPCALTTDAGVQ
ncbi:MAG: hypothetical protein ABIR79_21015, partial [Candidatus Binatia bacterium]